MTVRGVRARRQRQSVHRATIDHDYNFAIRILNDNNHQDSECSVVVLGNRALIKQDFSLLAESHSSSAQNGRRPTEGSAA